MRIRVMFLAAVAAVLLALGALPTPALAAGPGQIDGTVLGKDGSPISTCVNAYDTNFNWISQGCTDNTGAYTIDGLSDGTAYRLQAYGDGMHQDGWFDGATSFDTATDVIAPATADIVLPGITQLSGTLTDANGQPQDSVFVTVVDLMQNYVNSAQTNPDGSWSIALAPGDYKVEFNNFATGASMWFRSARSFEAADTLTVHEGAATNADAQFIPQATVTGTITDAATGDALSGVCVGLANPATWTPDQGWSSTCTDTDGHYSLYADAPGTYAVVLTDPTGRYSGTFIGGTRNVGAATRFDVGDTGVVVANGQMRRGAVITGKAIDSRTHKPVAGVDGTLYSGQVVAGANRPFVWGSVSTLSDANGVYTISGVPSGTFTLLLTPQWRSGYAQQWYQGATVQTKATAVAVKAPVAQNLKSTSFVPGGTVSGTVRDNTGAPVAGAYVSLDGAFSRRLGGCEGQACAQTDENGHYVMTAPEGTYRPVAVDLSSDTLAPAFYGGAPTSAKKLDVKPLKSVTADFVLRPGGHLSGSVLTTAGQNPNDNLYVAGEIYTTDGTDLGSFDAFSATDWTFRSSPLPPGTYVLSAEVVHQDGTGPNTTIWYDGAKTRAAATLVTLGVQQTKNITFHLP